MTPGNEIEYGALRRILQLSSGSSTFTMVVCDSPSLRVALSARLHSDGLPFHEAHLTLGCKDPVADTLDALSSSAPVEPDTALFIIGLDYLLAESTPGADHLLAVINRSRERWRAAFPNRAIVFWLTQHTVVRVLLHAPDLRAWVSHELEFTNEQADTAALRMDHGSLGRNYLWLSNLDSTAKRTRLAELERRLGATAPEPALMQEWSRSWDEKLNLLTAMGEYETALTQALILLTHYPANQSELLLWRAETLDHIANIYAIKGDYEESLSLRSEQLAIVQKLGDIRSEAVTHGQIADILYQRGQLDEALRIRKEKELPVYQKLGDIRSEAVTHGQIADILYQRGQLDEALRIHREKQLPVYQKLGDIRSEALTHGKIADILQDRGQRDEALRIRSEHQLPVYQKLGDIRSEAITHGNIADILHARGQLDDALRIRTEKQLPVYQKLGDIRSEAITHGQIADIFYDRGQLDEALRIRKEIELPVYQKLGDIRSEAVTHGQIADILQDRGQFDEALHIRTENELPVYQKLGDIRSEAVTHGKIADILHARGQLDEALRIRTEKQLPVYQKLGDIRSEALTHGKIADILHDRDQLDEALLIRTEKQLPVFQKLGDTREEAVTHANLAQIYISRLNASDNPQTEQQDSAMAVSSLAKAWHIAHAMKIPEQQQIEQLANQIGVTPEQLATAAATLTADQSP